MELWLRFFESFACWATIFPWAVYCYHSWACFFQSKECIENKIYLKNPNFKHLMVTKLYILDTSLLCRNWLLQYFFQALEHRWWWPWWWWLSLLLNFNSFSPSEIVDLNWTISLFVKICPLSLKNYHTTYREKQQLWNYDQGQTQIRRWKCGLKYRALGWAEAVLVSSWDAGCVGNKKCEIPFHHMLSARTLGSIYSSCVLAEPVLSIPSVCLHLPINAGQGGARPQFLWTLLWCSSFFSVISKYWCGKGTPPGKGSVP